MQVFFVIIIIIVMLMTILINIESSFNATSKPVLKPKKYCVRVDANIIDETGNVEINYYPMEYIKLIGWVNLWDITYFENEIEYSHLHYKKLNDAVDILKRRQKYLGIEKEILIVDELPKD